MLYQQLIMTQSKSKSSIDYLSQIKHLAYRLIVLSVSFNLILFSPMWLPFYLIFTSTSRTIKSIKNIYHFLFSLIAVGPTDRLEYALLKGNGKYLKTDHAAVFTHQFYDYTARKFMSLGEIDEQFKIAEIECNNLEGLQFLKQKNNLKQAKGMLSNISTLNRLRKQGSTVVLKHTVYDIDQFSKSYSCILCYSLKSKYRMSPKGDIDIIKVINYIKHHLSSTGYVVFGQFLEVGEQKFIEELFDIYGFKIVDKQNIQKNLIYAQKVTAQNTRFWEEKIFEWVKDKIFSYLNDKNRSSEFTVYILETK